MNRYDLARWGPALATFAVLSAAAPAATAGSQNGAARRADATSAAVVASATPARAPAWLPEWIGPAPQADVLDYSALYGAPAVPTAPGMIVAIDPETGRPVRPSAAQRRALALGVESTDLLAPSEAPMLMERLPNGGVILTLNGHYQLYSVARIGPDGRPVTDCAHDASTAKRMLTAPTRPRVRAAEKE